MVCGYGDQVGYETLVRQIARAEIDKSSRFTDWTRRPLSAAQMAYALADVTHLRKIYEVLAKRLAETGRAAWVEEELAVLTDPATYRTDPDDGLDPDQDPLDRAALHRRAARARPAARDDGAEPQRPAGAGPQGRRAARARRQPAEDARGAVEVAPAAARGAPGRHRGRHPRRHRRRRRRCPPRRCRAPSEPPARKPGSEALADLLRVLLKARAEAEGVAQRLIASGADLDAIAAGDSDDVPALHGWRLEVFGRDALRLKRGEIALSADGSAVKVVPLA